MVNFCLFIKIHTEFLISDHGEVKQQTFDCVSFQVLAVNCIASVNFVNEFVPVFFWYLFENFIGRKIAGKAGIA